MSRLDDGAHPGFPGPVLPPITTRVRRGMLLESLHHAHAVVWPRGATPVAYGSPHLAPPLRSVAKPFQTLAILRADPQGQLALTDEELAVITASHGGEPLHQRCVAGLLARAGCTIQDLQCGVHAPFAASERRRALAAGESFTALASNCSGKHAGMLLHARLVGADLRSYREFEHPVQRAWRTVLEICAGHALPATAWAIDGCGVPTGALSLAGAARAFLRLGDAAFLSPLGLAVPAARLEHALFTHPHAFSGEGRLPWRLAPHLGRTLLAKEGAEGLFVVWGAPGVILIKAVDGHERGLRYALWALLEPLGWLAEPALRAWRTADPWEVRSIVGETVGSIEVEIPGADARP